VTRVRFVAVGLRFDPARVTSLATFAASLEPVLGPGRAVGDGLPTLLGFPEHTGLLCMLVGDPGTAARRELEGGAGTVEALTALAASYGDQLGHYAATFPQVSSAGALLHLAVTDTVVHVLVETFGGLARTRRQWVSVGAALADWERIPAEAGAPVVRVDPDRRHAYVATSAGVRNRNLLFAPDGRLVAVQDKAYLVPLERDPEGGLGLEGAAVDRVGVADLPFGRLASVISKDAWMVDVNERLDQLGAQVLVQPEAFDRWSRPDRGRTLVGEEGEGVEGDDLWPPDKLQRGGWWMVQRHPSFRVNVTPVLLGSAGDLRFDGQPLIAVPAPEGDPDLGLLGQSPDGGWAAVGPWWRDPRPARTLADEQLRRTADGAGDPPPGGTDGSGDVLARADLDLPDRAPAVPAPPRVPGLGPSVAVVPDGSLLVPDLAVVGGDPMLVGIAGDGHGRQQAVVTRRRRGAWSPAVPIAPSSPAVGTPFDRQWRPRLVPTSTGAACLHLAFPHESWDLFAAVGDGERWEPPVRVDDAHGDDGVLRERGHDAPVVVGHGHELVAVWSDLRWPWTLPQVRVARSADGGRTWSASRRVDGGPEEGRADPLAPRDPAESRGQTAPAVTSTPDGLVVAWQEHAPGRGPTTWVVREVAGSWTSPRRLEDRPGPPRWRPTLAASGRSLWLVEEVADEVGGSYLSVRTSSDAGRTWGPGLPVDPGRPAGTTQRRASLAVSERGVVVVFEDDRDGRARVLAVTLGRAGPGDPVWRLDDAPPGADARAPAAVRCRDALIVAWQDSRTDLERVRSLELPFPSSSASSDDAAGWRRV
jgi:predicted amidohydrolase